ncbi:MAG: amino acid ABC transporter substrate-binding protein [Lachnospiraceae bacterium]|nr:amino acid ABC transporter substrate-binding protein [Lachnospiraceae bacterium]
MKKKLAAVLVLALSATTVLAGCTSKSTSKSTSGATAAASEATAASSSASSASTGTEEGAKKSGDTFTVGFDAEYPPFGFKDDSGEYTGFDLDLAQEVCDRNDWKLVKQPIDWDSKDMELDSGTIDCIWNGFTMTGREDKYTWSDPYLDNSQIFLVSVDSNIKTFADLAGKVVYVQADSAALSALNDNEELKNSFGELTEIGDYNSAVMNLEAGAADAVAIDSAIATGYTKDGKVVALEEKISSEQYAIGFKLGNKALRDQVQTTLDEMAKDGTVLTIAEKYADYNVADALLIGK